MKNAKLFTICLLSVLVLVSMGCNSSSITSLFATPTPTPTNTPIPTPTPLPTATPTATPTPLPTGVSTEEQADGSTLVVDWGNRFEFVLPDGWSVIPLTAEDLSKLLDAAAKTNPDAANMVEAFKSLDSDVFRVIALNDDPKYITKGFATNITVTAIDEEIMVTMPLAFVTGAMEEALTGQGATILSEGAGTDTNSNGVEYGVVDCMLKTQTATGEKAEVRSILVLFQTKEKLVMINLATPKKFGNELFAVLKDVIATIKKTAP